MLQVIDPNTGAPYPAEGTNGGLIFAPPANGAAITPSDSAFYDPPIMVWVGDTGPVNVSIVPYGRQGDKTVIYPVSFNMTIPVLCKQVLATGTTAAILRTGAAFRYVPNQGSDPPPSVITADSTLVTADTTTITADNG